MAAHLIDRVVVAPEENLQSRTMGSHTPSVQPRVIYDRDEDDDDQSVAAGRGIAIAVLLSAPVWALAGALIYYLAR